MENAKQSEIKLELSTVNSRVRSLEHDVWKLEEDKKSLESALQREADNLKKSLLDFEDTKNAKHDIANKLEESESNC